MNAHAIYSIFVILGNHTLSFVMENIEVDSKPEKGILCTLCPRICTTRAQLRNTSGIATR